MKRMKKLLLGIIFGLLPIIVQADAGAPSFTEYDVRVKNPDGTYVEKWNTETNRSEKVLLPYDTIIKRIMYEEDRNGKLYGFSDEITVLLEDCEVISKDINFSNMNKDSGKLYVYKEGAYLYKGPSKTYGKVDGEVMIPVGTVLEYNYSDQLFAYVTYNGVSGWVYYYQRSFEEGSGPYKEGSSLATVSKGSVYTVSDTVLYTEPIKGEKTTTTIPAGEKINYEYTYISNGFTTNYFVTYKDTKGWVSNTNNNLAKITPTAKIFTYQTKVNICKDFSETCKNVVGTIPSNTMLDIDYIVDNYSSWLHVNYNNISGWIYLDYYSEETFRVGYRLETFDLKVDKKLYDDINGADMNKVLNGKVEAYDFYIWEDDYNSRWIYVPNEQGWIKASLDEFEILQPKENEEVTSNSNNNSKIVNNTIPINKLAIYLVGGALILSLTTFVTIKLINRKVEERISND